MTTSFRAACLQMNSGSDLAANLEQFKHMVTEAAGGGAQFVLSPEYCLMMDGSGRVMREGVCLRMAVLSSSNCSSWQPDWKSGCLRAR